MRLDKYLAETAQCTRSEAKALLAKGRVQVNGAVCKKGDTQLKETDTVAVDEDAHMPASGRVQGHGDGGRRAAALSEVRLPHAQ